jgi:hypothetical protein
MNIPPNKGREQAHLNRGEGPKIPPDIDEDITATRFNVLSEDPPKLGEVVMLLSTDPPRPKVEHLDNRDRLKESHLSPMTE